LGALHKTTMKNLSEYITGLLFIHDCVILPGFGGFVTNYKEAGHDKLSHTFTPPTKDLLFNKNLTYNDGLLINHLSQLKGISYAEAEQQVKQSVDAAWTKLENGETLKFDGIGSFIYNNDGQLQFEPEVSENLLTDSYGMMSFRFPPLNYQDKTETTAVSHQVPSYKNALRIAAILVPIACLVATIPMYNNIHSESASLAPLPKQNEPVEQTLSASVDSDTTLTEVLEASTNKRTALFYNEPAPQKTTQQPATKGNFVYHIIAGSFKDAEHANIHAKKFQKEFNTQVVETDNMYRVSIRQFNDKVSALHELRHIRANEQYSSFWLLTVEK